MQVSVKADTMINIFVWPNEIEMAACNGGWHCFGLGGCCFVYVGHFVQDEVGPGVVVKLKRWVVVVTIDSFHCTIPHSLLQFTKIC